MKQDEGGSDDLADAPGAAAVAAQDLVGGLEQGVRAFAEAAQGALDGVEGLLVHGQRAALGFLERDLEDVGFAFVAQVGQAHLPVTDPQGDQVDQVGVGAGGRQVVFAAGAYVGGPQRPAVGGGDDLDVPAVVLVLAAPPQVDAGGGAGSVDPVGLDEGAVHDDVGVTGGLGRQQGVVQRGLAGGQHRDALVPVVVRSRAADPVVPGQSAHAGVVQEP